MLELVVIYLNYKNKKLKIENVCSYSASAKARSC